MSNDLFKFFVSPALSFPFHPNQFNPELFSQSVLLFKYDEMIKKKYDKEDNIISKEFKYLIWHNLNIITCTHAWDVYIYFLENYYYVLLYLYYYGVRVGVALVLELLRIDGMFELGWEQRGLVTTLLHCFSGIVWIFWINWFNFILYYSHPCFILLFIYIYYVSIWDYDERMMWWWWWLCW